MAKAMTPLVVDLSHHNEITDWGAVYASGIRAVIHKATQGGSYVDPTYSKRIDDANAAGLLLGAYHFGDCTDVEKQVEHFLSVAGKDSGLLLALDFEKQYDANGRRVKEKEMTLAQAKQFLQLVYEKTGQRPILYSGDLLKEGLGKKADPFFSAHRLWICQYGPKAVLPPGFSSYWLWQFTDGAVGPTPHGSPGISGLVDLNVFGGSDLASEWVHTPAKPAPTPVPERANATIADLKTKSSAVAKIVKAKAVSTGLTVLSLAAGATKEAAPVVPIPAPTPTPVDVINLDTLHKASDGMSTVKSIATTTKELAIAFAINEWMLAALAGVAGVIICNQLLGWHLEQYIYGLWHPNEEDQPDAAPAQ